MKREKPQINVNLKKDESALDLLVKADMERNVVYGYYFDGENMGNPVFLRASLLPTVISKTAIYHL